MGKKKFKDPKPLPPDSENFAQFKLSRAKERVSIRLDKLAIKQLQDLSLSTDKDRSELVRIAISEFSRRELEKRLTLELEAKKKLESEQYIDKGQILAEAFGRRLTSSDFTQGWNSI